MIGLSRPFGIKPCQPLGLFSSALFVVGSTKGFVVEWLYSQGATSIFSHALSG